MQLKKNKNIIKVFNKIGLSLISSSLDEAEDIFVLKSSILILISIKSLILLSFSAFCQYYQI